MTEATLDTSGRVECVDPAKPCICYTATWDRLSPFAQGYIEAMFANSKDWLGMTFEAFRDRGYRPVAFSDLAPETLAAILKDCGKWCDNFPSYHTSRPQGADMWTRRLAAKIARFPPLTVYLGDDGKVRLRPA